jgi:predicted metal-dependent phosphotriesterase family hydrolase
MRAVAQAHVWTGVPITVHVPVDNEPGLLAQDVLAAGGPIGRG